MKPYSLLSTIVDGIPLVAQLYTPESGSKPVTLFCLPGGSAQAGYFDLAPGYSFAKTMTKAGYRVVTMDHPGTASNPLPEGYPFLTPWAAADMIAEAASSWLQDDNSIGIGHSMGGMSMTLIEARHRLFKGLGLLGSNAGGLDWGLTHDEKTYIEKPDAFRRDLQYLTLQKFKTPFPMIQGGPSGKSITFGGETSELTLALRRNSCALFAAGGMTSMVRGSFRKEVDALTVPLFFAVGDHDIGLTPEEIPKDYINAASTELHILAQTGHNSFAFRSFKTLCAHLDHWVSSLDLVSRNL